MKARRHFLAASAAFGGIALLSKQVRAAEYPDRPVHFVVGFAPGGAADLVARLIASELSNALGQPVPVDNKPGADTSIAANYVAHAKADGYTILLFGQALTRLKNKVDFDPVRSFSPLIELGTQPTLLVVNASLPVRSFQDLVALAKSRPGQLRYGSAGPDAPTAVMLKLLDQHAGIDMVNVPYGGESPIVVALLGNEVQTAFLSYSTVAPQIGSGKLRALAISTNARSSLAPEIPTIAELLNYPEFDVSFWLGVVAPAGIPDDVRKTLHDGMAAALRSPQVEKAMSDNGLMVLGGSPDDFANKIKREVAFWSTVDK